MLLRSGLKAVGENRVQEASDKRGSYTDRGAMGTNRAFAEQQSAGCCGGL
jgi:uncharacterized pyridoxal phosphate-containing UPF0001 family protein